MNKLVKGSIAGAAGIALLLGGAGTLAMWNSEAAISGSTVNSGTMTIDANGAATATYAFNGGASGPFAPATDRIVPGDVVAVSQNVTIAASGAHLKADLTIDETALVGSPELLAATTLTVKAYAGATEITPLTGMSAATAASITKVVVTIDFAAATADELAQADSINLANVKVVLTQVP